MIGNSRLTRAVSRLLLPAFTLLGQDACVTTDVGHRVLPGSTDARSAVEVSIHLKPRDVRAGVPFAGPVSSRLLKIDEKPPVLVRESEESRFALEGLAPGRYRVEVVRWKTPDGKAHQPKSPSSEDFRVAPGEKATVSVILSDTRGAWWAVGITLGALVVVGIAANQVENDMEGISFY